MANISNNSMIQHSKVFVIYKKSVCIATIFATNKSMSVLKQEVYTTQSQDVHQNFPKMTMP